MRNDALGVVSKLAASPNNVFTRSQAADQGLDHRRIAALKQQGLLAEPWRGALAAFPSPGGPTWLQMATASVIGTEAVVSHRAAARLHRLDGFVDDPTLELTSAHAVNVRRSGAVCHRTDRLPASDVVVVDGVPTTNVARTLADIGSVVPPPLVERALDDALRRGANVVWLRRTAEAIAGPRLTGPSLLLRLIDAHERRGTVRGSWFERLVEDCLDHPELDGLVIQHTLRDDAGHHVATFDLAVPDARLGIEAHSRSHHFGAEGEASDERRDHRASVLGWDVMYLGYASVRSPRTVRAEVLARVRARRALISGTSS